MLRHACGFALANKGHDTRALQAYLGHRNIQHTVRYTELSPGRRLTEERLEFAVRQFDWIEVGRVFRQVGFDIAGTSSIAAPA